MMNPTKRKEISHMLKKILCGFLAVAMAATAFAGCSSNGNGSSSAAGSSEAGSTPAASSEAGSGEETNLRLALWDYDVTGYDKVMVEAFQEKNPNIKVCLLYTSIDSKLINFHNSTYYFVTV